MSVFAAVVKYNNVKHCFASLSSNVVNKIREQLKTEQKEVIVISVEYGAGQCVFLSCTVEKSLHTSNNNVDVLELSGLFANRIGLKEDEEVVIRIENLITHSQKVFVEPYSTDDWEILEENASFVESHLLDQVRVVWPGEIIPIWVNKSICTFITIDNIEPTANYVLLSNDTEVYVSPKIRSATIQQPLLTPSSSTPLQSESVSRKADSPKRPTSLLGDKTIESELERALKRRYSTGAVSNGQQPQILDKRSTSVQEKRSHPTGILGYITSFFTDSTEAEQKNEGGVADRKSSLMQVAEEKLSPFQERLTTLFFNSSFVYRIQPMSLSVGLSRDKAKDTTDAMYGGSKFFSDHSNFHSEFSLLQPSSVFINKSDLLEQFSLQITNFPFPKIFIAKLKKLLSPKENEDDKKWKASPRKDDKSKSKRKSNLDSSSNSSQSEEQVVTQKSKELSCFVKVVIVDTNGELAGCSQLNTVMRLLQEQCILKSHIVVPELLRRQLRLDKSGKVSLQPVISKEEKSLCKLILHIVGSLSQMITFEMVKKAFRAWIKQVAPIHYPLVTSSGLFVKFPVFQESWIEALVFTSNSMQDSQKDYHFLHRHNIDKIDINVLDRMGGARLGMVVQHPAFSVADFDPPVPSVASKSLGGVNEIMLKALRHIEVCLGTQPLMCHLFSEAVGLQNGMLLITGSKGAGKTSIVRALCKQVAEYPNLAHVTSLSCKPLRGKKVDTIQKILEFAFDEAAWRQPSVIVFDDLDHIAGSVSNPDAPIPGEEHYKGRIAEVLKKLIMLGIQSNNRICIIATGQSTSSMFSSLVMSRGTHFIQETIHIDMPNKVGRKEILKAIIDNKVTLNRRSMDDIVLEGVVQRTEGFVARDLENLVNRAIHAYMLLYEKAPEKDEEIELSEYEFDAGLKGFTPVSLRNVPLHTSGELGWSDVGGLHDVKKVLKETLMWPTKYPTLLGNCPLRLRSGLLLFGAPGTGKTLLAGVVAKECGLNFISIKGPELLSKYIGASEQAVRDMFYRAQSAKPCILFFDEFDSIAPRRGHDSTGVTDRVVNQLLTQLDGVEALEGVYVLGATSRPDLIDPALLRPGRFDKCLHCGLPDEEERYEILKALSKSIPLNPDVNLSQIAGECQHFTGADFKALLYNAQLEAIHEFTKTIANEESSEYSRRKSREIWGGSPPKARARVSPADDSKCPVSVVISEDNEKTSNIFISKLEGGIVNMTKEKAEKVSLQLENLQQRHVDNLIVDWNSARHRRSSVMGLKNPVLQLNQSHFIKAMSGIRLSVPAAERIKYKMIYDRFVEARGAHFGSNPEDFSGKKATLA